MAMTRFDPLRALVYLRDEDATARGNWVPAAEYKNGVLTVKLPFREEAKPRTINVEVAA